MKLLYFSQSSYNLQHILHVRHTWRHRHLKTYAQWQCYRVQH